MFTLVLFLIIMEDSPKPKTSKRASFSTISNARDLDLPIDIPKNPFDTCVLPTLLYAVYMVVKYGDFQIYKTL